MTNNDKVAVKPPHASIEGVRSNVALKIFNMLKEGRRYFGSSGASLTHQAFNPAYKDKDEALNPALSLIGLEGERETTLFLKEWIKDKPNAVLIDSVHIRGWGTEIADAETGMIEGGDTDHILLIGDEVLLIDTKRWKKKSNYTVDDNGSALRANKPFPGGDLKATQAMYMWLDYLEDEAKITTFVCINSPDVTVFRNRNWFQQKYRLVEIDRFKELLDTKYEKISDEDKININSTLVAQVAVGCVKPYDQYSRVFDMGALAAFKG